MAAVNSGVLTTTVDDNQISNNWWRLPLFVFFKDARFLFKYDALGKEILGMAVPAALAMAADPLCSIVDTAFIGHLGAVHLAAAGVAIAIYNQASRITVFPIMSLTTSFVAEEQTLGRMKKDKELADAAAAKVRLKLEGEQREEDDDGGGDDDDLEKGSLSSSIHDGAPVYDLQKFDDIDHKAAELAEDQNKFGTSTTTDGKIMVEEKKPHLSSASTAIVFTLFLGLFQAIFLILCAPYLLSAIGARRGDPMTEPAKKFLTLRALGSPAVLLSLCMQSIFRGLKDTKTPLYCIAAGDALNIILDPVLIFGCRLGLTGAAIAHVAGQYFIICLLLWRLLKEVDLMPPCLKDLQFKRFLGNGIILLGRVIAVTFCTTFGASMAARLGDNQMAAFQIGLQVWITTSLLADGLAVAIQAILATALAEKNYDRVTTAVARISQMALVLGLGLGLFVAIGLRFGYKIFSKDPHVIHFLLIGLPFIAGTQPLNVIAFVFDGVNFGASDFAYTAYSMGMVAAISITSIFLLAKSYGFMGIWIGLSIYMTLRSFAGIFRVGTGIGPWRYLRGVLN